MKVADPWACQTLQEAHLEGFQEFQGKSFIVNIILINAFQIFSHDTSFSTIIV